MRSPNRLMTSEIKNISIDQDLPTEEDNDTTESSPLGQDPAIIENACPQCSAFRANADQAWDILREFQTRNEENKKYKNEIHQLESQLKESRDYISALRQQQQEYDKIIKDKDLKITLCDEKITNLEDQYNRVLRAGRQQQHDYDRIVKEKDISIKNCEEKISVLEKQKGGMPTNQVLEIIKEKDLRIKNCEERISVLEKQKGMQTTQVLEPETDPITSLEIDDEDLLLEKQKGLPTNQVLGPETDPTTSLEIDEEDLLLEKQKGLPTNQVLEPETDPPTSLEIDEEDLLLEKQKDLPTNHVLEPETDPTTSLEIDEEDLLLEKQKDLPTNQVLEPETDPPTSLEIDEEDLLLEMPLSPSVQNLSAPQLLSVNEIFNSSFFLEHAKLKLIEDLEDLDLMLPEHVPSKKDVLPQVLAVPTHQTQFSIKLTNESAKLQIHNISKKYNVDKKQASLLYSQAKRDANKQRKRRFEPSDDENDGDSIDTSDTQKSEKAPRHLLPWVPHRQVVHSKARSALSYEDHKRYVGIIVNQLQSVPKYRFEHNKNEIQALDQKLENERNFYIKNALQSAKQFKAFHFDPLQLRVFVEHYREIIKLYIGQRAFQGILCSVPWPQNRNSECSTSQHPYFRTTKILSPGLAPKTQLPDIKRKFIFSNKPVRQMLYDRLKGKQPIDEDKQLVDFAPLNGVQVSMDASTLRHLLSAPWAQRAQTYACKLKVVSRVFSGKLCTICIVSPPLIASRIHKTSIPRAFAKWGLKAYLFGKDPSFEEAASSNQPKDSCQSLLDDLGLGDVGKIDTNKSRKRYSIISFDDPKLDEQQQEQHRVLIRTTLHANELRKDGQLQQISLTSRVEFLPEIGAEKLSNEEEIWNFVTGLLKGSEEHLNFRLKVERESVVLQYDRRLPTKLSQLSTEAISILAARINRIKTLIKELSKLSVGEYLLMPDVENEVLNIIKQKTESEENGVQHSSSFDDVGEPKSDLWESRSRTVGPRSLENVYYDAQWFDRLLKSKLICSQNELFDYWNGIDPHYPLQWHVLKSQIPGALYPKRT
ncbi:hypothetical protein ACQ4LE_009947 [Meloidogyne hapla]|uniref:NARG2_C domain-containing protein n=1 Tax=Meloidogyne hapla TaxID=6305 RepID=A0A1I8BMS3_MELHA